METFTLDALNALPAYLLNNLHYVWTFILISTRFISLFIMVPGLGGGLVGMQVRIPGVLILSVASLLGGSTVLLPENWYLAAAAILSEILLGMVLGMLPRFIVSGIQAAGQLSSTTMGLNAGSLIDPALGTPIAPLSKVFSDLATVIFFLIGGHRVMIQVVSGMDGQIIPGTFFPSAPTVALIIEKSSEIFTFGILISAPVVVALLITQFIMGLISKAVPSVNVFVVSFPLTVGVGLLLSVLCIPGIADLSKVKFGSMDQTILTVIEPALRQQSH
jgi:flagellar biosynthesis protein FliR